MGRINCGGGNGGEPARGPLGQPTIAGQLSVFVFDWIAPSQVLGSVGSAPFNRGEESSVRPKKQRVNKKP